MIPPFFAPFEWLPNMKDPLHFLLMILFLFHLPCQEKTPSRSIFDAIIINIK